MQRTGVDPAVFGPGDPIRIVTQDNIPSTLFEGTLFTKSNMVDAPNLIAERWLLNGRPDADLNFMRELDAAARAVDENPYLRHLKQIPDAPGKLLSAIIADPSGVFRPQNLLSGLSDLPSFHWNDLSPAARSMMLRGAGEVVGAAFIALDSHETRQQIARALASGDLRGADEMMGGLLGRAFGGAFAAALVGAEAGLWFGVPGAIVGAIAGGILGTVVGGEIGEWLFGVMHDAGINDLIRKVYGLVEDILADPIVLDLDGDGIELTALAAGTTLFDLDSDGVAERTGWVSPHDGLLVHDSNGNGLVDGIAELLGSAHVDGYDELAGLDSNRDGRIDSADPAFAELKVWRDFNSDGVSTPDEMLTLAQAGIVRFDLAYSQTDTDLAGNVVARAGAYVRSDGTSRAMASVRFALDESAARPVIPAGADLGDLPLLPSLPAAAGTADLRTAMFFDPALRAMVEDLVHGAHDFGTFRDFADGGFTAILYRWAGVDASAPEDPDHPHYLKVFEALTGLPLAVSNDHQRERLAEEWPQLLKQLGMLFLVQAARNPSLEPFHAMLRQVALLDPEAPSYMYEATAIADAAIAASQGVAPAYDYLALFGGLSVDPATGRISGDFDAFVAGFIADQPSFAADFTIGMAPPRIALTDLGDGDRHPWTIWYEEQGSLVFTAPRRWESGRTTSSQSPAGAGSSARGKRWMADQVRHDEAG